MPNLRIAVYYYIRCLLAYSGKETIYNLLDFFFYLLKPQIGA